MSKLVQSNGDDHPEAAAKNLEDSRTLLVAGHSDGSGYLAGYVVECVLKTLLLAEKGVAMKSHDLAALSSRALLVVSTAGSVTGRHLTPASLTSGIGSVTAGWKETIRYRPSGAVSAQAAQVWLDEADVLFRTVVEPLWLDGVL